MESFPKMAARPSGNAMDPSTQIAPTTRKSARRRRHHRGHADGQNGEYAETNKKIEFLEASRAYLS